MQEQKGEIINFELKKKKEPLDKRKVAVLLNMEKL